MTPQQRQQEAKDLVGILARGYDVHVEAHGPDDSRSVRADDGSGYVVGETMSGGAVSFVERAGERFAVVVVPLAGQDQYGPLFTYSG